MKQRIPPSVRFWEKVDLNGPPPSNPWAPISTGCWLWTGQLGRPGYGRFWTGETYTTPHRWAYEDLVGRIPEGLTLDHLCRVRNCVNPAHMEPVTASENVSRGHRPGRDQTHCIHGHPFDEANTYYMKGGNGLRKCKECTRLRVAQLYRKRMANDPEWVEKERARNRARMRAKRGSDPANYKVKENE